MMSIAEILTQATQRQIHLYVEDSALKFKAPKGALTPDLASMIKQHKAAIIDHLQRASVSEAKVIRDAIRSDGQTQGPLSSAQQRLWFIDQLQGGSAEYNLPVALRLKGQLNRQWAEQAMTQVIERHEILRTVYVEQGDGVLQCVQPNEPFCFQVADLTAISALEQQAQLKKYFAQAQQQIFSLQHDRLVTS